MSNDWSILISVGKFMWTNHWSIWIFLGKFVWTNHWSIWIFLGKFVWTNGPESFSKVSPYTGICPWMALPRRGSRAGQAKITEIHTDTHTHTHTYTHMHTHKCYDRKAKIAFQTSRCCNRQGKKQRENSKCYYRLGKTAEPPYLRRLGFSRYAYAYIYIYAYAHARTHTPTPTPTHAYARARAARPCACKHTPDSPYPSTKGSRFTLDWGVWAVQDHLFQSNFEPRASTKMGVKLHTLN